MAEPRSTGCQCLTDDATTEDTWSVTTDSAAPRRLVLRAFTFLHVQDQDTGVTRLVAGPCSYSLKPNERVILEPQSMVIVPVSHYCTIENPVQRAEGHVTCDEVGQVRLRHGEKEVRLHQAPFPLYPGETMTCGVRPLPVVGANQALRVRADLDTVDEHGKQRRAGEEWLFGPGTYTPCPEVTVVGLVDAVVVGASQALRLRAARDITDGEGTHRKAGEEWLMGKKGAYMLAVGEEVVETVELELITLTNCQYCVVSIPVVDDKPQHRILRGPKSFYLQPGEILEDGIRKIRFLEVNEGLDMVAREAFTDETVTPAVERALGDRWTVVGPAAVTPPAETEVLRQHSAIPLGVSEGVYVQDTVTGKVRVVDGEYCPLYLLKATERLWNKELPADAEKLLAEHRGETDTTQRDKTRLVTYSVHKECCSFVEIHSTGQTFQVQGPNLIKLQPDQQIRVFSLPGGTPVVAGHSKTLSLPFSNSHFLPLTDVFTLTKGSQHPRSLTVKIRWGLWADVKGRGIAHDVAKDDPNQAFLRVRHEMLTDACQFIGVQDRYSSRGLTFNVVLINKQTKKFDVAIKTKNDA